jgi:proteasome lid subunit RPN8/RPN11
MKLTISRAHIAEVLAASACSPDAEICGLLLGQGGVVEAVRPCTNVADEPSRRFEIDPAALFSAHRAARAGGPVPIGHYHSHPSGQPEPSACDAEAAEAGAYWLIVAGDAIRCWYARQGGERHGMFDEAEILSPDGAQERR